MLPLVLLGFLKHSTIKAAKVTVNFSISLVMHGDGKLQSMEVTPLLLQIIRTFKAEH